MKWLFIIVALLNIIYGAYNLFLIDEADTKINQSIVADKSQIIRLNELDANALKELQDKMLRSNIVLDDTDQFASGDISESKIVSVVSTEQDAVQHVIHRTKNLCYKLGPFTKDVMNEIRLILEAEYKNQLSFGIETTSDITYYRIYIPPLVNKEKIKDTLALLDENGLKDHYVMSIDGRKNAIALGVFKERSAAEKVAGKAAKLGLSTTIEAISDDKNSLYQLLVIFQDTQETVRYHEIISEKKLISVECDK